MGFETMVENETATTAAAANPSRNTGSVNLFGSPGLGHTATDTTVQRLAMAAHTVALRGTSRETIAGSPNHSSTTSGMKKTILRECCMSRNVPAVTATKRRNTAA